MRKLLKIIILIIVMLFVLVVGAGLILFTLVNPNNFKGQISTWVHKHTGRELIISGDIERSFFPSLGLQVHNVRLTNAIGFEPKDNFINVGQVDVSIKLMPLLSRKVEIDKVVLNNVELNLAQDARGNKNWQDLISKNTATPSSANSPVTTTEVLSQKKNLDSKTQAAFNIAELQVNNANISWVNAQKAQEVHVKNLHLKAKHMSFNNAFPLFMQFQVETNQPALNAEFSFDADVTTDSKYQQLMFSKPRLSSKILSKNLPKIQLGADQINLNLKQQTLDASNVIVSSGDFIAKLTLQAEKISSQPVFTGNVRIAQFNLKEFCKLMGHDMLTRDPAALQRVAASTDFIATPNSLQLSSLMAQVDDSTIKARVDLKNFAAKDLSFNVDIDQINLDRYLRIKAQVNPAQSMFDPVLASGAAVNISAKPAKNRLESRLDKSDLLRASNVNGILRIASLTVANTRLNQVFAQLTAKEGVLNIAPAKAEVFQGNIAAQINIDMRDLIPKYTLKQAMTNIQLNQLIKSDRITGVANVNLDLATQGLGRLSIMKNLNGTSQFRIENGALLGVDISYELERAVALIRKQPLPPKPSSNQTTFSQFSGTGVLTNGLFTNNDLQILSERFKITGKGTANLVDQNLDFHLLAEKQIQTLGQQGTTPIPVLVTGTLSKPIITPDIQAIAALLLKQQVKEKIQQIQERVGNQNEPLRETIRHRAAPLLERVLQR